MPDRDRFTALADEPAVVPAVVPAPYRPRSYERLGSWWAGPLRLKAYGIRVHPDGSPQAQSPVADAARRFVAERLPPLATAEGHHGLGFVILHEGEEGSWLLMDWWAHNDISCQRVAHAATGTTEFTLLDRPLLACVWELVVISFERNAWVQTMLTAQPDPEAYLSLRLDDGRY